ncbi:MAG: endonuclease [Candidatus Eremiobacteraeota bacterium]|nr:endonuclease [Candidatus Eremiobacteraeota bacterium]
MASTEDALILARAVDLLLAHRDVEAGAVLRGLPGERDPIPRPVPNATALLEPTPPGEQHAVDTRLAVKVFDRARWRCQYCGRRLVVAGVIELIGRLCLQDFPWESHAMPAGRTHPAAQRVYPNVDHVHPVSRGGAWRDADNLVSACTPCNTWKSDKPGWSIIAYEPDDWDGLKTSYRALLERVGERPTRTQQGWLKALGL